MPSTSALPPAHHVGSATCKTCHEIEFSAWKRSHHAQAMAPADDATVLGRFDGAQHRYGQVTSTFTRKGDAFVVNTDGADGKLSDFVVRYTFGLTPLQQYLVELPGGRLQALGLAWDARAADRGGQRWFHLYPGQDIRHDDPLHWTGLQQNWNFMCADCHSTALRKGYDPATRQYRSQWSEISVGCEACHGPASHHLSWAGRQGDGERFDGPGRGFRVRYDERDGVAWPIDPATGIAQRSKPRESAKEISTCAQCHARRAQFSEDYEPGRPIGDAYLVSLLDEGLYWRDGQMRDEVFNHGSFLQSRMHAKGVTCSDCHEPHSGNLRASGNAVCTQCHASTRYDVAAHHHHEQQSEGARCVACHMPPTTYMVVDPRHDHSMRVPRPDLSVRMGTPNACTTCHVDREPAWAAKAIAAWTGGRQPAGFQSFAEAFHAWARYEPGARGKLLALVEDRAQPAIVRASALTRLARDPQPSVIEAAAMALNDADELVRRAGVDLLAATDVATRVRFLPRMAADPVRAVRIAAGRALAAVPGAQLPEAHRAAASLALDEYVASQHYNADRPEAHLNLGALHQELGRLDEAETAYLRAIELYPGAAQGWINLADLHRVRGDEDKARSVLEDGLRRQPQSAPLHHALGLSYARLRQSTQALKHLAAAHRLAGDEPRYAYVYAVALNSYGDYGRSIAVLERAHARFPVERDVLLALASMLRDRGEIARARTYAQLLVDDAPEDIEAMRLLRSLER